MTASVPVPAVQAAPADAARVPRRTLAVAVAGTLVTLMVFTAPLATLAPIADALGADVAGRIWILSSMSIGLGAALLSSGTIADDFGRRATFVAGAVVLSLASFVAALAPTPLVFVLARVVQGLGGAAVLAAGLGLIAHAHPHPARRAGASALWGASLGAGIAVGPLVAAALDRFAEWRDCYWLLGAAGLAVALVGQRGLPESRAAQPRGLDLPGALLFGVGTSALLAALVEGRMGWARPVVLVLVLVAVLALVAFAVVQARVGAPMLEPALLRQPAFVAATLAAFVTGAGVIAAMAYLTGFLGSTLSMSLLGAASLVLVWSGSSVLSALAARRIPVHVPGRWQLAIGLAGVAVGLLALGGIGPDAGWPRFVPGLLVAGVASGLLNAALGRESVASVPVGRAGMGSGANNTARYVGSAVGVTVVAVLVAGSGGPIAGWNLAVLVTAGVSVVGALLVLACRPRR